MTKHQCKKKKTVYRRWKQRQVIKQEFRNVTWAHRKAKAQLELTLASNVKVQKGAGGGDNGDKWSWATLCFLCLSMCSHQTCVWQQTGETNWYTGEKGCHPEGPGQAGGMGNSWNSTRTNAKSCPQEGRLSGSDTVWGLMGWVAGLGKKPCGPWSTASSIPR